MFISLCGLPASGKTTLSKKLSVILNAKLYCCDDFFLAKKGKSTNQIIREFHEAIRTDLTDGHTVICDGTYTIERTRRELLDGISAVQCKKIIVVLTTPFEECLRRNDCREAKVPKEDMCNMQKTFTNPTVDEGWDEVIYIN